MLVIIDYGLGNLRSVQKAFQRIGKDALISNDPLVIRTASRLILPGVGHFARGMQNLKSLRIEDELHEQVLIRKVPILGICLGMQLMTKHSEEGDAEGLSWVEANTVRFNHQQVKQNKIPHMGWNSITASSHSPLLEGLSDDALFYFVHSFYVQASSAKLPICSTEYGVSFTSGFRHENIFGVQFHPEKSHQAGLTLLKNFSSI